MDKYTREQDKSSYNNQTIINTLFRDAMVYLPGQTYPDLYLSTEGPSTLELFIEKNNERQKVTDKMKILVSEYIKSISEKDKAKITYVFIYSCRNFSGPSNNALIIYQHELLTYSLNLMLFPCKKKINSGISKAFSKSIPRSGQFTLHGDQKRGQIKAIFDSLKTYLLDLISYLFPGKADIIGRYNLGKFFIEYTQEDRVTFLDKILKTLKLDNPERTPTFAIDQMGIFQILNYLIYDEFVLVGESSEYNKDILSRDYCDVNLIFIRLLKGDRTFISNIEDNIKEALSSIDIQLFTHPVFKKSKEALERLRTISEAEFSIDDIFSFMINPIIIYHKFKQIIDKYIVYMKQQYTEPFRIAGMKTSLTSRLPTYGHKGKEIARTLILGHNSNV